jgi:ribonuclease HII
MAVALSRTAPAGAVLTGRQESPTLHHETWLWAQGYARVAGVDEAGRGALAGPLVAAAVILPPDASTATALAGVRDSKLLSSRARSTLYPRVQEQALAIGVAVIPAHLVDAAGLSAAGQLAFRRAVEAVMPEPDFLLLDAFRLRDAPVAQLAVVHGDACCLSIAAASVVAKVVRDQLMDELHAAHPCYAFDRHKGYGTAAHQAALAQHGPCREHRRSYGPVRAQCGC